MCTLQSRSTTIGAGKMSLNFRAPSQVPLVRARDGTGQDASGPHGCSRPVHVIGTEIADNRSEVRISLLVG